MSNGHKVFDALHELRKYIALYVDDKTVLQDIRFLQNAQADSLGSVSNALALNCIKGESTHTRFHVDLHGVPDSGGPQLRRSRAS